ncbi:hypothetical protein GOP47_0015260 [Adiantum capillus-veneris]|uniref:Uncharacterized protein n=1 Tax=Adiantum capillus-veneris TaxID=13818 RepID=A0A9D4UJD0_ADICA|nr:hypothetical protein GOP47_0015260 [Adiantum capillus-veneris]
MVSTAEMVVHRRIVVLHHGAYGHFESFSGPIECLCSVLFMVHRVGMRPPCFVAESTVLFSHLGMQSSDSFMMHHVPELSQARSSSGEPLRGGLQRSHYFVACFMELLCRNGCIFLELGCGYVLPLLRHRKRSREDPSTSLDIDDEGDMPSRVNPFDD